MCPLMYCLLTYNTNSLRYAVDTTGTRKERCGLSSPTSVSRGLCVKHTFERRENPETIFSFLLFVPARSATGSDALVLLVSGISTELKPTRTTPTPWLTKLWSSRCCLKVTRPVRYKTESLTVIHLLAMLTLLVSRFGLAVRR